MRLRVTFSKSGALKYSGHLDLYKIWERAARRAGLPLAYSRGFHPQPKIHLASALPLGIASRGEIVDLRLAEEVEVQGLAERLQSAMPPGLDILEVQQVEENAPALQTQLLAAEYRVTLVEAKPGPEWQRRMDELLARPSILRARRGRTYDLRPLIEALELTADGTIRMRLAARQAATGRPQEVLMALGIPPEETRIERVRLIFRETLLEE